MPYRFDIPTKLIDNGRKVRRVDNGVRVRQIPGHRNGFAAPLEGGRRVSEDPQGQPRMRLTANASVMTAIEKGE